MTFSIIEVGAELLARAAQAPTRIATKRIPSDNPRIVRILIVLAAGGALSDHPNPGEAVLTVHSGTVRLSAASGAVIELAAGQTADIPQETHRLDAETDAIAVLTLVHRDARA